LLAVILSAQATDVGVNKATPKLFAKANTPKKILSLGTTKLKKYIKTIGLYNTKAKNIINLCKVLVEKHCSQVPSTREELEKLPGVGRKTANVILNTAFHQPTIAVDTHVFRVANRVGLAQGKTPLAVEMQLEKIIPQKYKITASHILLLHGRYTCKAKNPWCSRCVINKWCEYYQKDTPHPSPLPNKKRWGEGTV
jgi:endonuclease III